MSLTAEPRPVDALLMASQVTGVKRKRVLARYNGRCSICGDKSKPLTIDHIVPRSLGGTNAERNLQPACLKCNQARGAEQPGDHVGRWRHTRAREWVLSDLHGTTRLVRSHAGNWRIVEDAASPRGAVLTPQDFVDMACVIAGVRAHVTGVTPGDLLAAAAPLAPSRRPAV